jgi:hypothetical protein
MGQQWRPRSVGTRQPGERPVFAGLAHHHESDPHGRGRVDESSLVLPPAPILRAVAGSDARRRPASSPLRHAHRGLSGTRWKQTGRSWQRRAGSYLAACALAALILAHRALVAAMILALPAALNRRFGLASVWAAFTLAQRALAAAAMAARPAALILRLRLRFAAGWAGVASAGVDGPPPPSAASISLKRAWRVAYSRSSEALSLVYCFRAFFFMRRRDYCQVAGGDKREKRENGARQGCIKLGVLEQCSADFQSAVSPTSSRLGAEKVGQAWCFPARTALEQ